ncbi:MAG: hypothetical protein K0Q72_797 [Armatimonadetes bacterium]|nr:hypothetical protein [Armatimonadota bacterium]
MMPEPQQDHQWLHQLVGEWTYAPIAPESSECQSSGVETVRSIGGLWIQSEGHGELGGDPSTTVLTVGYDPQKGKYVGTWIGSMMTYLWIYEGERDGNVLTLECEGPSFDPEAAGKLCTYQDIVEIVDADHWTLTARVRQDDGSWYEFMKTNYSRKQ